MFSPSDYERLWSSVLSTIEDTGELSAAALDYWFARLKIEVIDADLLLLKAENDYIRNFVLTKYRDVLFSCVERTFGAPFQIEIIVETPNTPLEGEGRVHSPIERMQELLAEEEAKRRTSAHTERRLSYNGEYTFDNFIVGSSNKFAHAAAQAVANNPASTYNPLFIYGPSGLGKTHLMYAITNKLFERSPDMNAIYINGEDFTTQLIEAISRGTGAAFREKYRTADMLLIDDIQFIAGKESTQEEFFHTFNALYRDKKQIILTSDRPPREMTTLEERIRSRFEQGLIVDIQLPDYELRLAILKKKAESIGLTVSDEILAYIAEKLHSNIRQLEGIIKRISANHLLNGAKVDMDLARSLVPMFQQDTEPVSKTVEKVIAAAGKRYGVSPEDILGTKRTKDIKDARNLAMYIIRQVTELSLPDIGEIFQRDHSTIHSNIMTIEKLLKTDAAIAAAVADIRSELKR